MSELQIKLMHRETLKRLHDAERLDTDMVNSVLSDSGYLLDLMAFELLLKAVTLIHAARYKQNHNYEQLFESLPVIVKNQIISRGTHWSDQSFCWPHLQKLLMLYSNNFIKMRYPFECYKNMDESEYIKYGKLWIELGAPIEEAEFQYYHKELNALNKAFLEEVEKYLASK